MDAPLTSDHLQSDGKLRGTLEQAAFSARDRVVPQQAVQLSAVLAAQPDGALEDASLFPVDVGAVHLHLRADTMFDPRPVVFRWTFDDVSAEVPGLLAPSTALSLAASYPVAADQAGLWTVEVLGVTTAPDQPAPILYQREFEVMRP